MLLAPSWSHWNAISCERSTALDRYVRLASAGTGLDFGKAGGHYKVTMRARLFTAAQPSPARSMLKVGGTTNGYALSYHETAGAGGTGRLLFASRGSANHVCYCDWTTDGLWHNFYVDRTSGSPGVIFIDGVAQTTVNVGDNANTSAATGQAAVVGATEGGFILASGTFDAGDIGAGWSGSTPANIAGMEWAYLRIERDNDGARDLEIYVNEGTGNPVARVSGAAVSPALINSAPWVAIAHDPYVLAWPMAETADMTANGATLSVTAPANLPVISTPPGGGQAMLCEATGEHGHSELLMPLDAFASPDVFLAFDTLVEASSLSPAMDGEEDGFFQFVRVGGLASSHDLLTYLARYHDRLAWHVLGTVGADTDAHFPFDQWVRFVVRWRPGRDSQGQMQLWVDGVDLGTIAHSLDMAEQLRVRARTNPNQTTLRQWFSNVAISDTYDGAFNARTNLPPTPGAGGGGHSPGDLVPMLMEIGEL